MEHKIIVTLQGNDDISKNLESLHEELWQQIQVWSTNYYTPARGVIDDIEINIVEEYFRGCDRKIYKIPTGKNPLREKSFKW